MPGVSSTKTVTFLCHSMRDSLVFEHQPILCSGTEDSGALESVVEVIHMLASSSQSWVFKAWNSWGIPQLENLWSPTKPSRPLCWVWTKSQLAPSLEVILYRALCQLLPILGLAWDHTMILLTNAPNLNFNKQGGASQFLLTQRSLDTLWIWSLCLHSPLVLQGWGSLH